MIILVAVGVVVLWVLCLVRARVKAFMEVVLLLLQIRPNERSNIPSLFAAEVIHAPQRVCANEDAPENISSMVVTLDTSHLEMSTLNDDAE